MEKIMSIILLLLSLLSAYGIVVPTLISMDSTIAVMFGIFVALSVPFIAYKFWRRENEES